MRYALLFRCAWPIHLSNIAQPGTQSFYQVTDLHYKDPYVHGTNLNQPGVNTLGYSMITANQAAVNANLPFPLWQHIQYNTNLGYGNYNAATFAVQKRMSNGLQFQRSYIYARNLSNVNGAATSAASA